MTTGRRVDGSGIIRKRLTLRAKTTADHAHLGEEMSIAPAALRP
ncbi:MULTISPECIES: hypothetical protein [unclassified Streptomyces]|nr:MULTISPECIES: hypothetical protein [unclassified Streptomyces]